MADKPGGKGTGPYAVRGHEKSQEDRLAAIEDALDLLVADGTLPTPDEADTTEAV